MRKITLFLLSLLFTMTTFAEVNSELTGKKISAIGEAATEVVDGQWYILNNVSRKNYVSEETDYLKMRATTNVAINDPAPNKAGYLFKFTKVKVNGEETNYWNIVSGNGKYFSLGKDVSTISDKPVNFLVGHQNEESAPSVFYLYDDDNKFAADGQDSNGNFVGWSNTIPTNTNGNDVYRLLPISLEEATFVDVTYTFTYKENTKFTQSTQTEIGKAFPDYTIEFPFGVIPSAKPTEVVSAQNANQEITLSIDLPFEPVDTYNKDKMKWYYIKFDSNNNFYLYHKADQGHIALDSKSVDANNKDNYSWGFVGNPFDGYKIMNRATGDGYILSSTTDFAAGEANVWPIMTETTALPENNNTYWVATNSTNAENGFYLAQKDYPSHRMNNRDSKLAYWTGGAGTGSTFVVEERDMTGTEELQAFIGQVENAILAYGDGGNTVGYYTAESVNNLLSALQAAKEAVADEDRTAESNNNAQSALQNAINNLATIQPKADAFYTIKNQFTSAYMNVSDASGATVYSDAALNELFQFVNDESGNTYLYNVKRAKYLSHAPGHGWGQILFEADNIEHAKAVTVANLGVANQISITPDGGATLHHDTNYSTVVGWNASANSKSAWFIEEVKNPADAKYVHGMVVGETGWATLYLGCDVTIPEGVEAYTVKEIVENSAVLEQVAGVIPAKCPVIIKAEAGEYRFAYSATKGVANETNLLAGTTVNANIAKEAYVLDNSTEPSFVKAVYNVSTDTTNDGTEEEPNVTYEAFLNNAFCAYLPKGDDMVADYYTFSILEEEDPTAIENVEITNEKEEIFDITGRKVNAITTRGIYIINGKKVIK